MRKFKFKRRVPGEKNQTEEAWETMLRKREDVDQYFFERVKLKLADNTFYTPDFMVFLVSGEIEFHEVKGSWKMPGQDDSRVKIKVAAEQNRWATFRSIELKKVAQKNGGGWQVKEETF